MDWKALGTKVAQMGAEVLGQAIPLPGADEVLGALADQLGTEKDPDKIAKAIENDPEARLKLEKIQSEHEATLKKIKAQAQATHEGEVTKRQETVNETIQVGYKEGVKWRRAVGWSFAIGAPLFIIMACVLLGIGIWQGQLVELAEAGEAIFSALHPLLYCYLVILGAAGYQEGKMGRSMAGDKEGGISRMIKAIRGGKE